jgi:xylan 1,4-beta-xylosidase
VREQYDFSDISYEFVGHEGTLPFKSFLISVGYRGSHWHREFELILVLRGDLVLSRGESVQNLKRGDLCLINPYEIHSFIKGAESNTLLVLQVEPVISSATPFNLNRYQFQMPGADDLPAETARLIKNQMIHIQRENHRKEEGYHYECMAAVNALVAQLIRRIPHELNSQEDVNTKIATVHRMNRIIEYLNDNYHRDIALKELAELVDLSTFYVSHLVKEQTGQSFRENLSLIRTHHAVNAMLNTNRRLIDIAFDAGFSDIKYFNRSFKKLYGMTPSQIRKLDGWREIIQREYTPEDDDTWEETLVDQT